MSPWEVVEQKRDRIVLKLRSRAIPPFDYEATQVLSLDGRDARHGASAEASRRPCRSPTASASIPGSCARRASRCRRMRPACGWSSRRRFRPRPSPRRSRPSGISTSRRPLPDDFIDNGYAGWDGRARIDWTDRGVAVDIEADPEHALLPRLFARQGLPDLLLRAGDASEQRLRQARHAGGERPARARAGAETSMRMRLKATVS